jgi:hypothetical protein
MRALTLLLVVGCGSDDAVKKAVQDAVNAANTTTGRTGIEMVGKAVWLDAPMFDPECVTAKNLAFHDDPRRRPSSRKNIARLTPLYETQRWLVTSTEKGYCLYVGDDPQGRVEGDARWVTDHYELDVRYSFGKAAPFGECLDDVFTFRTFQAKQSGGDWTITGPDLTFVPAGCPSPLPGGEERAGSADRPTGKPSGPPSKSEVVTLMKQFDDALWDGDFLKARSLVSCYNLWEEKKVGSCSVAEFLSLGPVPRGQLRPQDGTSWLESAIDDPASLVSITPDKDDPTLFAAHYKHKRTGSDRSIGVQWAGGAWKLVGVAEIKGEGLTSVRFLTDLHDRTRREIFERRMKGEEIDYQGNPLKPPEEEAPE